ncbi:MAG: hypothetical protein FWG44_03275 [Oscillospiraceae bacterium]|nr:hypothetical protein [Oscillospiraceae bacterium]
MNDKKFIHGNKARVNIDKNFIPRFTNYVVNDYTTADGNVYYNRLDDDADFCRNEVNENQK